MTPEAQRIAIAEACGWRDIDTNPFAPTPPLCGFNDRLGKTEAANNGSRWGIPDYPNDLNAMHEAEKMLTDDQFERYVVELGRVFYPKGRGPWKWSECPAVVVRATAAQRAGALLRTLGKWEDDG